MMRTEIENGKLVAYLDGRIDATNAPATQRALEDARAANPGLELVIDAGATAYISSAGLRVLQSIRKAQGSLTVRDVTPEVWDILDMTGFTTLMNVKRKPREVSVEGCEVVGRGAIGTVYRLDEDTIVKVYEIPDSLPMIENEQRRAKQAFLRGIPTAISYDIVKVGNKYGSVFEMLKATTFNDIFIANPESREELTRRYARFLRQFHAVEMERGELPEVKTVYLGYLENIRSILPEAVHARLKALLEAMPENLHAIHGDFHMKNIMFSGDEPLVIDMDTLGVGDPVFDMVGIYVAYVQFAEDDPGNNDEFFGFPDNEGKRLWSQLMRYYFEDFDDAALRAAEERIIILSQVRFLYLVTMMNIGKPQLARIRVDHALARLEALVPRVDSLEVGSL